MPSVNERFIKIYKQNTITTVTEIWVDKQTGVNYLYHALTQSGGLTPLLDRDGKPIISSVSDYDYDKGYGV